MAVNVDDVRAGMRVCGQDLAEASLGGSGIPTLGEIKVQRGARGVQGSIQVRPAAGDANVRFIHPPGRASPLQFSPRPSVESGSVALHPPPKGGV